LWRLGQTVKELAYFQFKIKNAMASSSANCPDNLNLENIEIFVSLQLNITNRTVVANLQIGLIFGYESFIYPKKKRKLKAGCCAS